MGFLSTERNMTDVGESIECITEDESEVRESERMTEALGERDEDEEGDEDDANEEEYVSEVGVGQSEDDLRTRASSKSNGTESKQGVRKLKSLKEICMPSKIQPIPNMERPEKSRLSDDRCDDSYYYNLGFADGFNESNAKNKDYVQETNDYSYNTGFNSGFNTSNCLNEEYNDESSNYWYDYGYNAGFNASNCENQQYTEESNKFHYEAGYNKGWNDSNCATNSYVQEATDYSYRDGYNHGINEANYANDGYTEQVSRYYYEQGYNDGFNNCRCKREESQSKSPCSCLPNTCICNPCNNTCCPSPCTPCYPASNNSCNNCPCCCSQQQTPCCSSSMCRPSCYGHNQSGNGSTNSPESRTENAKEGNAKTNSGTRKTGETDDLYNNNYHDNPNDEQSNKYRPTQCCNGCCCCCGSPCNTNGIGFDIRNQEPVKKDNGDFDFKNITIVCESKSSGESDSDDDEIPTCPPGWCFPYPNCNPCYCNPCCSSYSPCQTSCFPIPIPCVPPTSHPSFKPKSVKSTGTNTRSQEECFSQSTLTGDKADASIEKMENFDCLPKPFLIWPTSPPNLCTSGSGNETKSNPSNNPRNNAPANSRSHLKQNNPTGDGNGKSFQVFIPYQALGQPLNDPCCSSNNCCPLSNFGKAWGNSINSCGNPCNPCDISSVLNVIKQQLICGFEPTTTFKKTVNQNTEERRAQSASKSSKGREDQNRRMELRSQIQDTESRLCEIEEDMQSAQNQMCDAKLMKRTAKDNLCRIMQMISVDVAESFTPTRSDCTCNQRCDYGPERLSEDLSKYRNCDPNWRHESARQKPRRQKSNKTTKNEIASQYADRIKELEETITTADNQFYESLSEFRKLKSQKDKLESQLCRLRPTNPVIAYGQIIEQDGRKYRVLM